VARTYQTTLLFGTMSVADNLAIARPRAADPAEIEALLGFVGYRGDIDARASDLPHVDKRLVEIARALAMRPSVLLLDEPAAGLSEVETAELARLVRRLADDWGIAVLLVEHDMNFVMSVCDHIVVLDFGIQISEGSPSEVRRDSLVIAAYLGEDDAADERDAREATLAPAAGAER
jgi:ABC-type branched-subunit amino acid transport system ATPase component